MTSIYVAGASKDLSRNYDECSIVKLINCLEGLGHHISFNWPRYMLEVEKNLPKNKSLIERTKGMKQCMNGVIKAEVVVFYATTNFPSLGSIMEYAFAIEHNKKIAILMTQDTDHEKTFSLFFHPFNLVNPKKGKIFDKDFFGFQELLSFIETKGLSTNKTFKLYNELKS